MNGHKDGTVPGQICGSDPEIFCFEAPRLVGIDEHHNLEVQSWDCRRSLRLDRLSEPSTAA